MMGTESRVQGSVWLQQKGMICCASSVVEAAYEGNTQ